MANIERRRQHETPLQASGQTGLARDLVSSAMLGLGLIAVVSPVFFYWFIHGDTDRYLWIINGPAPFDQFGGGPYQLWTLYVLPFLTGVGFIGIALDIRRRLRR